MPNDSSHYRLKSHKESYDILLSLLVISQMNAQNDKFDSVIF